MNKTPILPPIHSHSQHGPLYEKKCASCGVIAIVDKRRLAALCRKCAPNARKTHGLSVGGKLHPLYRLLQNIKARCDYPSATHYVYYGGRGISVCKEWREDPSVFISWAISNGWAQGLEVDRFDTNGNYCPENCRLISHRENSQRTRRIKTTPDQVRAVRELIAAGTHVKIAAEKVGVTYMVAWHIKNSPDVWSNIE